MGKKLKYVRHRRIFSESLKKQIVKEYEQGKYGIKELERIYQVGNPSIYSWIYKYSQYQKKNILVVEMKSSQTGDIKRDPTNRDQLGTVIGAKYLGRQHQTIDIYRSSSSEITHHYPYRNSRRATEAHCLISVQPTEFKRC